MAQGFTKLIRIRARNNPNDSTVQPWCNRSVTAKGQPHRLALKTLWIQRFLEQVMGLEPTTSCLGSKHSTN